MIKSKFFFNEKSLEYEKVSSKKGYYWFRVAGFLSFGLIVAFSTYFIFGPKATSSEDITLAMYKSQFKIVNKEVLELKQKLNELIDQDNEVYRGIYGLDSISEDVRESGIGGTDVYAYLNEYSEGELVKDIRNNIDKLRRQYDIQDQSYKELLKMAKRKKRSLAHIPAIQPIKNKNLKRMASGFGYRIDPFYRTRKFHAGMDFTANTGTDVYATANGRVERVQRKYGGYGRNIIVNHGNGYKTLYAHLSASKVKVGQKVVRGQVIGAVGNTGKSTGPHLHYEVRLNNEPLNPSNFYFSDLTNSEYEAMLKIAALKGQSFD